MMAIGCPARDAVTALISITAARGTSFTQIDATHWQINSADHARHDVITLSNAAAVG